MTILIAHRALFEGPNPELENHPDQIRRALEAGYNAEIDVRLIDGKWWLGHDGPTYEITPEFLTQDGLWIHAKNIESLASLRLGETQSGNPLNYFWHQEDDVAVTSAGWVWTYPGKPVLPFLGILVQPEWFENWRVTVVDPHLGGICSKYVKEIAELRK